MLLSKIALEQTCGGLAQRGHDIDSNASCRHDLFSEAVRGPFLPFLVYRPSHKHSLNYRRCPACANAGQSETCTLRRVRTTLVVSGAITLRHALITNTSEGRASSNTSNLKISTDLDVNLTEYGYGACRTARVRRKDKCSVTIPRLYEEARSYNSRHDMLDARMLDMSQTVLADAVGVTFQQVQKYEKGVNRISASRLQGISQILQVPIPFFFDGVPGMAGQARSNGATSYPTYVSEFLSSSNGLKLVAVFTRIRDKKLRRSIVHLVEQMAGDR